MTNTCPNCGGKLKRHGKRHVGSFVESHRDCQRCGYGDKVLIEPEKILHVSPVIRRRTLTPPQPNSKGV
jgi:C4-type Zn-finger protein